MGAVTCGNWLQYSLHLPRPSVQPLRFSSPRSRGNSSVSAAGIARVSSSLSSSKVNANSTRVHPFLPNLTLETKSYAMPACPASESSDLPAVTSAESAQMTDRRPVLLFDVMDTLVRDPFYEDMPRYFGLSMKELLQQKHPSAWVEFETGKITEEELGGKFFADGREFDYQGLKECMVAGYCFLDGMEVLLEKLRGEGYSMHAFTNYPCWYQMIESKLQLSKYLPWTFVSCHTGRRKPDSEWYLEAARHLQCDPQDCVFVDDRSTNVEAARAVGMKGIVFQGADELERELREHGVSW